MSWNSPPPIFEHEDERELKLAYARALAKNPERAASIGYDIFPGQDNYGRAMQAQVWQHDPVVRQEIERLQSSGAAEALNPDKDAFAAEVLRMARAAGKDNDAIAAMKLHAEVMGYLPKGGVNVNVDNRTQTIKVLRVPAYGSSDSFRTRLKEQQTKLIANARSTNS